MKLGELGHELISLARCYPSFVTGGARELEAGQLPIFVFHSVLASEFEEQLRHIVANNYRPLGLAEFLDTISGRREPGPREILLTFDDARTSFWLYGFPLLKKYGVKAALFAITGWTPHATARPNLDDVWAERVSQDELEALDPDDEGVCSWDELAIMHASGLVTVDSHSHLHRRVFKSRELLAVLGPDSDFSPSRADHSPYLDCEKSPLEQDPEEFFGLPIMQTRALLDDGPALGIDRDAVCEFQGCAREMLAGIPSGQVAESALARLREMLPSSAFEARTPDSMRAEIRQELALAQENLRRHLSDSDAGRTLCIPYTEGGMTVVQTARELGVEAMFWGVSTARKINQPGQDPMHLVRLKNDFIWRLPGEGRRSLLGVYSSKTKRRLAGIRPY